MKHTINLFGFKLTLMPTIDQGAPAVNVVTSKFSMVMDSRVVPVKDIASAIDAFTAVTQEAEALMVGQAEKDAVFALGRESCTYAGGKGIPLPSPRCVRVMPSGKACGLTAPCPDCGLALHDVPEGS